MNRRCDLDENPSRSHAVLHEVPRGPEDRVERLRTAEPPHFDSTSFPGAGLHVTRNWDELFDQPLLRLRRAQSKFRSSIGSAFHLVEEVINLLAKIEPVKELAVE